MTYIARISTAMLLSGLFINPAKAAPSLNETSSQRMDGLYLGVAGAYETAGIKATGSALGAGGVNDSFNQRIHAQGGAFGLYGGYGAWYNSFYYGVEGSAFLSGLQGKSGFSTTVGGAPVLFTFKSKKTYSINFAGRAGFSLGQALVYVKGGIESARWRFSFSRQAATPAESANQSRTRQLIGFAPGFGIELPMGYSRPLLLRVEYTHTFYPQSRLNFAAPVAANYQGSVKFKPSSDTFMIGITYKFNQH